MFAETLMAKGETDYVKMYLWTNNPNVSTLQWHIVHVYLPLLTAPPRQSYHGGSIKYDLDYVANGGWQTNTCDLWEEVRDSDFFWNRVRGGLEKAIFLFYNRHSSAIVVHHAQGHDRGCCLRREDGRHCQC